MNRIVRILLTAGVSAAVSLPAGAGVAQAAPQQVVGPVAVAANDPDEFEFYDYYSSKKACHKAGTKGKDRDEWYDYDCEQGRGKHSDEWALYVAYDDEGEDEDDDDWDDDEWFDEDPFFA